MKTPPPRLPPLIARFSTLEPSTIVVLRCRMCDTDQSPEWRRSSLGPASLCNACGLRYSLGRLPQVDEEAQRIFGFVPGNRFKKRQRRLPIGEIVQREAHAQHVHRLMGVDVLAE